MKFLKNYKLQNLFFPALIFILWAAVVFANYTPNTYLTGWDNLHPEFNFGLNITRSLSATWQEYQGVGLLGGMAHAADLPRQIILWIFSFALPNHLLRWSWSMFMLLTGPLGVYYFVKNTLSGKVAGFGASVFYLFNLATVQYFYTPFEAFITFYGAFPWLILSAYKYLKFSTKRNLAMLLLISFLSTTAFYVQTLFVVYGVVLGGLILSSLLFKKTSFKSILVLGIGVLVINAFWLLPVAYFTLTNSGVVANNKSNLISTPETRLMNQGFGDLQNIVGLKGFWLEYTDFQEGQFGYLMQSWHDWTQTFVYTAVSLSLFAASVLGFVVAIFNKKQRSIGLFGVVVLLFSTMLLSAGEGFLGLFYDAMSRMVPLFADMFRSPFTKWSIPLSFATGLGIGILIYNLSKFNKYIGIIGVIFITGFSVYQVKPLLDGHLIHQELKQEIPNAYFELFDFFDSEPAEGRIARFPVATFWGWDFNSWQYRGSGFLWYGIRQPILDRAFDVWNRENEEYYWQIRNAVYQKDPLQLKEVLQKYQIKYALLDESVVLAGSNNQDTLMFTETKQLLEQIGAKQVFGQDFLSVYKIPHAPERFVFAPETYVKADLIGFGSRADKIFSEYGPYLSGASSSIIYPFWDLNSEVPSGLSFKKDLAGNDRLFVKHDLGKEGDFKLVVPALEKIKVGAQISYADQSLEMDFLLPELRAGAQTISFKGDSPVFLNLNQSFNRVLVVVNNQISDSLQSGEDQYLNNISVSENSDIDVAIFNAESEPRLVSDSLLTSKFNVCWQREGTVGNFTINQKSDELNIKTQDQVACTSMPLVRNLQIDSVLEFNLPFKSESGASPHFCIIEEGQDDCLNSEVYYQTPTSKNWAEVSRKVFLEAGKSYWVVVAGRPPEIIGENWEISYKQPFYKLMPLVASVQVDSEIVPMLGSELVFDLNLRDGQFELSYPLVGQKLDFATQGRFEPKNCDLFERGEVSKSISSEGVLYEAGDWGASCDYVNTDISTKWEYVLHLSGINTEGRSLKAYLYNPTLKLNELEVLAGQDTFSEIYAFGGWANYKEDNYVLNLETRSFGPNESKNILKSVQIYDLPISWLSSWRLIPNTQVEYQNNLTVESVSKYGTFIYKVKTKGEGILALSQSYDKGWVAISQAKVLSHYELNSWANAWEVSSSTIYLFYWPQLLQIAGFGLLVLVLLKILIFDKRS